MRKPGRFVQPGNAGRHRLLERHIVCRRQWLFAPGNAAVLGQ
jgi:hypothetical protein